MIYLNNNEFDYIVINDTSVKKVYSEEDIVWENVGGDFIRVEYIENLLNAYIDTGLTCNTSYSIDTNIVLSSINRIHYLCGGREKNDVIDSDSNYSWGLFIDSDNKFGQMCVRTNSKYSDYTAEANLNYHITGTVRDTTVEYQEETTGTLSFNWTNSAGDVSTYGQNLYLFNVYQPNINANNSLIGKMYYFKIYDGSTLIRDFVPMFQISTRKYGLYDKVNNVFYPSIGPDEFSGGPRVLEDTSGIIYYIKSYISVSSTKYINIGIYPDAQDSWEADYYFSGTGRNYAWGSWSSGGTTLDNSYGITAQSQKLRFQYDNKEFIYSYSYGNKRMILKADKNMFYKDGQKLGELTEKTDNQASKYFYLGNFNGSSYAGNGRIYYFKYWRHGELVRDYIPAQRCSDGVWGFFDKARNVFQGSATSTAFTGA